MEMNTTLTENLIHVGSVKLKKNFLKKVKDIFNKHFDTNSKNIFQFFTAEELSSEDKKQVIDILYEEIQNYAKFYMTLEKAEQPILKLNGIADIKIVKQLPNKETDFEFDARSINSLGKILTVYIFLNEIEIEGEIEFHYQKLKIQPSKNEIIIFPSYFTHMHRLNKTSEEKYFIKATFYIGG